jgi:hypothetical protein
MVLKSRKSKMEESHLMMWVGTLGSVPRQCRASHGEAELLSSGFSSFYKATDPLEKELTSFNYFPNSLPPNTNVGLSFCLLNT